MPRAITAALVAAAGIAGCGSDTEKPKPVEGPAKEVAATVQAFEAATARRDYRTVCRDLFSAEVRRRAGGPRCPSLLRRTAADVRDPRIRIRKITIVGDKATVEVTTTARGQAPARDSIALERSGSRWRISELSR
jgi:hypothetical protein